MSHAATDIRERLERWRLTGDPGQLWPGVAAVEFRAAMADIGRATRAVLANRPGEIALRPVVSPRTFGVAAFSAGVGALLGHWVETGRVTTAPPFAGLLAEHLARGRARARVLHAAVGRVLEAFSERRIQAALLKGTHTGLVYFAEPGTRPAADIDLLVEMGNFEPACRALADLGFRRGAESPDGPRIDWIPPNVERVPITLEMEHERNPWGIDLHGSLDRVVGFGVGAGFGAPRPADGDVIQVGGRSVYVLPQPLLLSWLALHTASHLDASPLIRYLELVLVIRRDFAPRPERWGQLLRLVEQASVGRFVYPALELAEKLAPGSVPPGVRERLQRSAPRLARRVVARLEPETAQQLFRRSLDVRLMWVTSMRELVTALRGPAASTRGFLDVQLRRLRLLVRGALGLRAQVGQQRRHRGT